MMKHVKKHGSTTASTASTKTIALVTIAGFAVASAGGFTSARWLEAASASPQTITAGNLDLTLGALTWADTSSDATGTPALIDPVTFRTVPGDTLRAAIGFDVETTGDNMLADLTVADATTGDPLTLTGPLAAGMSGKYTLVKGTASPLSPAPANPLATALLGDPLDNVELKPTDNGHYTLVIDLTFDPSTPEDTLENVTADLNNLTVNLKQVRPQ